MLTAKHVSCIYFTWHRKPPWLPHDRRHVWQCRLLCTKLIICVTQSFAAAFCSIYMPSGSITLSGLPSAYITDCRVLTAHNSPNYQPPSPLSGPSLKAACHPPSPPSVSTLTTRRMLCLKSAVPESLLDLLWQVHFLTACLLLSQEDASAGTLRPLWAETFLPVYPGSVALGDHTVAPLWKEHSCLALQ